jgi:carbamoyltransferase
MLFKYSVRERYREAIRGVVHVDNSSRVQTIDDSDELRPTRVLLDRFEALSGIPILLNTSFNLRGEPLVNSYRDVLEMLERTDLSAAYLGNIEVAKPARETA